jgi:hypothetical protein
MTQKQKQNLKIKILKISKSISPGTSRSDPAPTTRFCRLSQLDFAENLNIPNA